MKEEWRTIKETNGRYSVSNLGNVKRNEHYTIVSPTSTHTNSLKMFYKERKLNPYLNIDTILTTFSNEELKEIIKPIELKLSESK